MDTILYLFNRLYDSFYHGNGVTSTGPQTLFVFKLSSSSYFWAYRG
ncbi:MULTISPECIES: hypothetical protein [Peribacillus]|nr:MULTISPECIES: hypothetical protein [Peribacillus]MEA3572938.1 hypothetical protein [Peribacillus frigoritolerans]